MGSAEHWDYQTTAVPESQTWFRRVLLGEMLMAECGQGEGERDKRKDTEVRWEEIRGSAGYKHPKTQLELNIAYNIPWKHKTKMILDSVYRTNDFAFARCYRVTITVCIGVRL